MWHSFRMYKAIDVSIARTKVELNCVEVIFSLTENKFLEMHLCLCVCTASNSHGLTTIQNSNQEWNSEGSSSLGRVKCGALWPHLWSNQTLKWDHRQNHLSPLVFSPGVLAVCIPKVMQFSSELLLSKTVLSYLQVRIRTLSCDWDTTVRLILYNDF